ncbi:hypothetical protein [Pseudobdellovibrio sp. HCB154]|uniref:hypothetical protein n=1 Tax=Pseudobdellovibrio sp. HCB154 TaxID=3386277 RepID=UPI0039170268
MDKILSMTEKQNLIQLADQMISLPHAYSGSYVLAAKWNDKWQGFKPFITSIAGFDRDEDAILLKFDYKPQVRVIIAKGQITDDEPEDKIVTGSIDPKSGRRRIVVDVELRGRVIAAAPFKSWINHKLEPKYKFPENLDTVSGWSNEKEKNLNQELQSQGLFKPESESMKPKIDYFKNGIKPEKKKYWLGILDHHATELHLSYPESNVDTELNYALNQQLKFDRLNSINPMTELMCAQPNDLKQSLISDLYETGSFDEFPFKFRVTAFLLTKGLRNAEDAVEIFNTECLGLKKFYPEVAVLFSGIYTTHDFYTHQSIIESLLSKFIKLQFQDRFDLQKIAAKNLNLPAQAGSVLLHNIWKRFFEVRNNLTLKQTQVVELLYLKTPTLTYQKAAAELGISFDSVRDREVGVILKFRNAFPEFSSLEPYKHYTKHQKRFYIYRGLVHLPSMETAHPCYRIKTANGIENRSLISAHDEFSLADLVKQHSSQQATEKTEPAVEFV